MRELQVHDQCTYCIDGQEVVDRAKRVIEEVTSYHKTDGGGDLITIRPIDFMLLDFQMPKKNGI